MFWIELKILLIVFKIFKGLAPSFLPSLITHKPESRYNLRNSIDRTLLSYPSVKSKAILVDLAFIFPAPTLWDNTPREIRESNWVDCFKGKLELYFLIIIIVIIIYRKALLISICK